MKRFCIIILSVLLLYAGVAWALGKCLGHTWDFGHAHEPSRGALAFEHPSSQPATHNGPDAKFECLHSYNGVELTLPNRARTQLLRLSERGFLQEVPAHISTGSDSRGLRLQRTLIFGASSVFPYHTNLPRYVLLSVFRI